MYEVGRSQGKKRMGLNKVGLYAVGVMAAGVVKEERSKGCRQHHKISSLK